MLNLASGFTPDWHLKFPSLLWTPGLWIAASLKAQLLTRASELMVPTKMMLDCLDLQIRFSGKSFIVPGGRMLG